MDAANNHQHQHAQVFTRHRGPITCAAEIPGSSKIITSGYDSAVAIFDRETSTVELLGYHQHLVNRVNVNADGTLAATSSSDYNIYIWDLTSNKLLQVLQGHDDDVEDFVFIDQQLGASVSRDWRIIVWNLSTGNIHRIIRGHQKDVLSIGYHAGRLYTSGDDMTLRVWDLHSGKQLSIWGPFETETDSCAIDPLNGRAVLGCDDGHIRVFDLHSGAPLADVKAHTSGIKKVAVATDSGHILSAAYDQRILIWATDKATGELQLIKQLASRPALWERSFNWSADGQRVIAGTFDGTVLVWDATSGACQEEIGADSQVKGNACFNDIAAQTDTHVVLVSDDGKIRVGQLDTETSCWHAQTQPDNGPVLMNAITVDPDRQRIIAGAHDQSLHIFNADNGRLQSTQPIPLAEGPINSIRTSALAAHAGEIFVGCYSGAVAHLAIDGSCLNKLKVHDNAVKALRLHPSLPIGVSCSADGSVASWNYDGQLRCEYIGHTAIVDDVDIDPSGRFVASTGRDFTLKVHGLDDGVLYHSIHLGRRSPKALCFLTPDVVVVTNYWGELIRVTLSTGQVTHASIAQNGISSITPLNGHLAAASYDGAVYLVEPDNLKVINTLHCMTQKVTGPSYA